MNYPRRTILRLMFYSGASLSLGSCMKQAAAMPANVDHYTCTMHPSVRSLDPHGKCPICGMDLVPVMKKSTEMSPSSVAAATATNEFTVPIERQQQIGVTYSRVKRRPLHASLRAVGTVTYDMSRHWAFVARTDGYVEQLFVTSPGQPVEEGQPLLSIYSPDLLIAEREFLTLLRTRDEAKSDDAREASQNLADAAKARLQQWNVTPGQLAALEKTRQPSDRIVLCSPFRGVVQEVPVHQGVNVKMGDHLVDVADLSRVWVWADLYENELSPISQGQSVMVTVSTYPGRQFAGTVSVINPFVDETTRTFKVRIDISNPDFALHPGMYADVDLGRDVGERLAVPVGAIMPTGKRNIAFVDQGKGKLAPRMVMLGERFGDYYEVMGGLTEGERVVSSANFLIDAEAKIQGALKDFDSSASDPDGSVQ